MFTQPKSFLSKQIEDRAYISFYYDGKRFREYNGNRLNLNINPNQCTTLKDKKRLLSHLQFEFTKALNAGWNPLQKEVELPSFEFALDAVLDDKLSSNLCDLYKRNLKAVAKMFKASLSKAECKANADQLTLGTVESFLNKFQSSERNYINRRRCLGTLINEMIRKGYATKNIVKSTKTARAKASLHVPYTESELRNVLDFLKINYPNLHLCCLLTYGCLLRPHHEVRLLKVKHIVKDFSQIQLSGSENKSKRIRTVYIPEYVKPILRKRLAEITDSETNIFSLKHEPFNVGYFNLMWGKASIKMKKLELLKVNQTIYSFRHTAAIKIYQKTKDIHILQQLLQHSDMIVTLNYLRGLGEVSDEKLRDVIPEL
ncbi:tyrosine-type recombinase/integrase [Pedobacter sandarakinus]|uniref:tyrosine-type recombinase/integrase n=1 Tax=Pedobacter sandarakinus TaxID=353156 RepID=UPI0022464707|nr:site-specific integrase [Pedobacter sandarakinus]MCX2573644.1 site-specific integrase [Pedobacter sandarakinus]